MSKILVLGATGTIGGEVALEFKNSGYTVYGLTRSIEKAHVLAQNQIIPIVGNVTDIEKWKQIGLNVDIIVEALADYENKESEASALKCIKEIVKENPKVLVIYTSDIWVHGDGNGEIITEHSPYNPTPFSAYREKTDLEYKKLGAVILKITDVYGTNKVSIPNELFKQVNSGEGIINFYGRDRSHTIPTVHVHDIARAFVLAAKKGNSIRGEVFIINGYNENTYDMVQAIAKAGGIELKEINFLPPSDPLTTALAMHVKASNQKARLILGFEHLQPSITERADIYLRLYRAGNDPSKNIYL
eukprot:gene9683-11883_t